jgi:uncharacterized protein (TIGR02271 family)
MTTRNQSPYTGRTIDEWLDRDIDLYDVDGDKIGDVVEVNPDFIVAESDGGFLGLGERRTYYVPRDRVTSKDEESWYLEIDKDEIETMNWTAAPTTSDWSTDWQTDAPAWRKEHETGTRLRRYEEDLEASTVARQTGEVSVSKRVVEDTKTVEVPVRREEIRVERRPVTGDTTASTDDAFGKGTIRMTAMEEDVEVRKVARPVEEIELSKTQTEETRRVEDTVRREEFEIDDKSRR